MKLFFKKILHENQRLSEIKTFGVKIQEFDVKTFYLENNVSPVTESVLIRY